MLPLLDFPRACLPEHKTVQALRAPLIWGIFFMALDVLLLLCQSSGGSVSQHV